MKKRRISDMLLVVFGGGILLAMIGLSWFPRECPVIKQFLIGCPSIPIAYQSPEQKEINRIAHQDLGTGTVTFTAKAEQKRDSTRIVFSYRADSPLATAMLMVKTKDGFKDLALVTSPAVTNLSWNRVSTNKPPLSLYQANPGSSVSIADTLTSYKAAELYADSAAATQLNLNDAQFTPLKDSVPPSAKAVLTTYIPPIPDGTWKDYEEFFDLTDAVPNSAGNLEFFIAISTPKDTLFRLGEVHINYQN